MLWNRYVISLCFLAEEQLCQYPGLTRGLVAVLLYYDGRKALVHALRTLIQGRSGVSWTLGASDDITDLISKYTQSLIEDGLVDKILSKYLTTGFWGKEAWRLTPKWNTTFFFAFFKTLGLKEMGKFPQT